MSKELEALERIKHYGYVDDWDRLHLLKKEHKDELDIIEKSLKALEIIKTKGVNVDRLQKCESVLQYNYGMSQENRMLIQAQFDLLKEVLV